MSNKRPIRCAIYTRKSTEEGLEQSFNSLQAQREACEAYIASQKHEGWQASATHYDDGGFSGGSMERLALQRLLADIAAGKVNVVLVYKVDRLTRSLADFAKIIEIFDSNGTSFVSVTQQFNTTSSMGRLTLNVLLSFAQFEREVTGERTRDKIAASKKKGMWMGGFVPLGYDLKDRHLVVNPSEAKVVREIFRQYIRLGRVSQLRQYLIERKIHTKVRRGALGVVTGWRPYSRGALYQILKNRLYLGEVAHRGSVYPGQHAAIIDQKTWGKTAVLLAQHNRGGRQRGKPQNASLLTGILFDTAGNRYTPTHAVKNGKRYRYYTSQAVIQKRKLTSSMKRIPAQEIEGMVVSRISSLLISQTEPPRLLRKAGIPPTALQTAMAGAQKLATETSQSVFGQTCRTFLQSVVVEEGRVAIRIASVPFLTAVLGGNPEENSQLHLAELPRTTITIDCKFQLRHWNNETRLVVLGAAGPECNHPTPLLRAIARARRWHEQIVTGEVYCLKQLATELGCSTNYVSRILNLARLSPAVVEAILHEPSMADRPLRRIPPAISLDWNEQMSAIGLQP